MDIPEPKINLVDSSLFGNDAAEDEDDNIFDSYFVSRQEVKDFSNSDRKLCILRAYRGEGKSAVIRHVWSIFAHKGDVVVRTTGSTIPLPGVVGVDPDAWTRAWQRGIFTLLASEIGSKIGVAWGDDAMSLVEEAEKNGFKSRSLLSAVCDRLQKSPLALKRDPKGTADAERVVARWIKERPPVWVFVDNVDENFENTREFRAKVASFFSACRNIVNLVPEVRVRAGIRPNVWAIVKANAESLSKAEQYVVDLRWDMDQMRAVLARRVEAYLERNQQGEPRASIRTWNAPDQEEKLISFAFQGKMPWGYDKEQQRNKHRPPHIVMGTLSRLRPRWMVEIAKAAAKKAVASGHQVIELADITSTLGVFGSGRVADLSAEYSSLCPQVGEVISAFSGLSEEYTTDELIKTIQNRIMQGIHVTIEGSGVVKKPMQIAALLYEIGFLSARKNLEYGEYRHYTFAEQSDLLHNRTNLDGGMVWEIHPVFRQALGLRSSSGAKNRGSRESKGPR